MEPRTEDLQTVIVGWLGPQFFDITKVNAGRFGIRFLEGPVYRY